jgi:uncharacterized protein YhaN
MKFKKLLLKSFGPFTEFNIDLEKDGDVDGLHVIYGPNEAGKSSTLRAISAMFFGIERSTQDNFNHDNSQLRVGAEISNADESIAFLRKKSNKATLLSANDEEVLHDNCLKRYLNGATKEMFFKEHAIGHSQLLAGGKALMANNGDVGQNLFSAGHGVVNLQNLIDELEADANALYTSRKQKDGVPALIREHKDLKREEKKASVSTSKWSKIDNEYHNAEVNSAEIINKRKTLQQAKNRLDTLRLTIPLVIERSRLLKDLEKFTDFTPVAVDVTDLRKEVVVKITNIKEVIPKNKIDIESTENQIAEISIPECLLDNSSSINQILQELGSYKAAKKDKTVLESEKLSIEKVINELLNDIETDLSLEDAQRYKLKATDRSEIKALSEEYVNVASALKNATALLKDLHAKKNLREKKLAGLEPAKEIGLLEKEYDKVLSKGDLQIKLKKDEKVISTKKQQLHHEYKLLGINLDEFEEVNIINGPESLSIEIFQKRFSALKVKVDKENDDAERFEEDIRKFNEALKTSSIALEEFGQEDLINARKQRETGWKSIIASWLEGATPDKVDSEYLGGLSLKDAYERDLYKADRIADKRFDNAEAITNVDLLTRQLENAKVNLDSTNEKLEALDTEEKNLQKEWEALWEKTGINPEGPEAMLKWLNRLELANNKNQNLQELRADYEGLKIESSTCTQRLLKAIKQFSSEDLDSDDLNEIAAYCGKLVKEHDDLENERKNYQDKFKETSDEEVLQQDNVKEQEESLKQWTTRWMTLIVKHGFNAGETTNAVTIILEQTQKIFNNETLLNDKLARIDQIDKANKTFETDLTDLLILVAPDLKDMSPIEESRKLHERFEKAKSDHIKTESLQETLVNHETTLKQNETALMGFEENLKELCQQHACETLNDLIFKEEESEIFRNLKSDISKVEEDLIRTGCCELDDIIKAAEDTTLEDVESNLIDTENELESSEIDKTEIDQEIGTLRSELSQIKGGDEAAQFAEGAEILITRIQKQAAEYITLTLALKILKDEIESYRKKNEAPLLTRANKIFPQLTLNSFVGLEISYEEDEPMLVGVSQKGRHVKVEHMSDGTRDQMFLALRLAALEINLDKNEPLPFIVDDILIQFDDDRAKATLEVLKETAKKTQILFFTHQARHVDLIKDIGGISVHQLKIKDSIGNPSIQGNCS